MMEAYRFGMITVMGILYIILRTITGGHKTTLVGMFACLIYAIKDDLEVIYPRLHWTLLIISYNLSAFLYLKLYPGQWKPVWNIDSRDLLMHAVLPITAILLSLHVGFYVTTKTKLQ